MTIKPHELTIQQRVMLLHVRRHGAVYGDKAFPGAHAGGGSVRRMAERLGELGLLTTNPPFTITEAGLKAIEMLRHDGSKMPPFWLETLQIPSVQRREDMLAGIEMSMLVRRMGDTMGVAQFLSNGNISFIRQGKQMGLYRNVAMMFDDLQRIGKGW